MNKYIIMLDTLQDKHGLLVEEEIYTEEEVVDEGFTLEWLFENGKAKWYEEKKLTPKEWREKYGAKPAFGLTLVDLYKQGK